MLAKLSILRLVSSKRVPKASHSCSPNLLLKAHQARLPQAPTLKSFSSLRRFSRRFVPIVTFLRGLPLPSTHPSHPAASAILNTLKRLSAALQICEAIGVESVWRCMRGEVVERAETIDGILSGRELGVWGWEICSTW